MDPTLCYAVSLSKQMTQIASGAELEKRKRSPPKRLNVQDRQPLRLLPFPFLLSYVARKHPQPKCLKTVFFCCHSRKDGAKASYQRKKTSPKNRYTSSWLSLRKRFSICRKRRIYLPIKRIKFRRTRKQHFRRTSFTKKNPHKTKRFSRLVSWYLFFKLFLTNELGGPIVTFVNKNDILLWFINRFSSHSFHFNLWPLSSSQWSDSDTSAAG